MSLPEETEKWGYRNIKIFCNLEKWFKLSSFCFTIPENINDLFVLLASKVFI